MKLISVVRLNLWWVWGITLVIAVLLSTLLIRLQHLRSQSEEKEKEIHLLQKQAEVYKDIAEEAYALQRTYNALQFLAVRGLPPSQMRRVSLDLYRLSQSYGFDPLLVLALVSVESRGDAAAIGRYRSGAESGALGLMQIKWSTALELAGKIGLRLKNREDLLDPRNNLLLGTFYLMDLIRRTKSLQHGIMAYNIGPGALHKVLRRGGNLPHRYLNRTLSNYHALVRRFGANKRNTFDLESEILTLRSR